MFKVCCRPGNGRCWHISLFPEPMPMWLLSLCLGEEATSGTHRSKSGNAINKAVTESMCCLNTSDYSTVTDHLPQWWKKCVNLGGDYTGLERHANILFLLISCIYNMYDHSGNLWNAFHKSSSIDHILIAISRKLVWLPEMCLNKTYSTVCIVKHSSDIFPI